ncbi:MAG: amidophosphoribosyltransferase [Phycisphaerales bacterium]|nr:amidophosphoribosyltransferase [Phycisphaerales bacterium]
MPIHLPQLRTDSPKEKCAVFGIWGGPEPAVTAYMGLYAQQHRGQESAGICVSNGRTLHAHTGMGLVAEVFDQRTLSDLEKFAVPRPSAPDTSDHAATPPRHKSSGTTPTTPATNGATRATRNTGCGAIGHNRYSTAGGSVSCNAQPLLESYVAGQVAIAHNGNLINADLFRALFEEAGHLFHTTSDTEVIVHLLASPAQQRAVDPLAATLRHLQGAFSLVLLFPDRVEAARDPWGWRPLVLGKLPDGRHAVASETVALDVIGAEFVREVEPGEIVTLSDRGVSSRRFSDPAPRLAHCIFEHVYFANPSSNVFGQNVQMVREALGARLSQEAAVPADYVMPMPDSGRSAAAGYARQSGIPYREGIVPNRYVGRTFIKPTQAERSAAVRLKLNVIREMVNGKRIVVVDDSIVRGTTTQVKMNQLREAGAKEIHLRISCPPIRHPCYFGVDFAHRDQLIAHNKSVEEIRAFLGVDSLHFLSMQGLLACVNRPAETYCTACYSGDYRLDPEHPISDELATSQLTMF